jgi:hypothetical protein
MTHLSVTAKVMSLAPRPSELVRMIFKPNFMHDPHKGTGRVRHKMMIRQFNVWAMVKVLFCHHQPLGVLFGIRAPIAATLYKGVHHTMRLADKVNRDHIEPIRLI